MSYYTDNLTKHNTEYTARGEGIRYRTRSMFMGQVYKWLNEHNIEYTWVGHQTSERGSITTYYLTVSILNEHDAMLFMLAWK